MFRLAAECNYLKALLTRVSKETAYRFDNELCMLPKVGIKKYMWYTY
jgi:hypothetical protein